MAAPRNRLPLPWHDAAPVTPDVPVYCIVGETLCQVRVWSDEEWERLEPSERPTTAEHVPGLGWVGAVLPGARYAE